MSGPAPSTGRRVVEVLAAGTLGIIVIPLVLLSALASFALYRAWPIFAHDRVGHNGQSIRVRKIRTLPPATDHYAAKYDLSKRGVPRSMQLIRTLHIDEFPQLWSVVRGDMTFVGPRPEMQFLHDRLPKHFASTRISVLPGITGLWQVSHASPRLIGEHPEFDVFYVGHRNLRLDLWIVYRTGLKMLTGRTAALDQIPAWALARARDLADEPSAVL